MECRGPLPARASSGFLFHHLDTFESKIPTWLLLGSLGCFWKSHCTLRCFNNTVSDAETIDYCYIEGMSTRGEVESMCRNATLGEEDVIAIFRPAVLKNWAEIKIILEKVLVDQREIELRLENQNYT